MDNNSTAPSETIERRSSLKDTMKFGFKKDTKKIENADSYGYKVITIWESELKNKTVVAYAIEKARNAGKYNGNLETFVNSYKTENEIKNQNNLKIKLDMHFLI
jgi:hypothetical protein